MCLKFAVGAGDLHQAASGIGHEVMIVANPAVAVVAAVGEAATKRSQTS
jgi:hypothetical protein